MNSLDRTPAGLERTPSSTEYRPILRPRTTGERTEPPVCECPDFCQIDHDN